MDIKIRKLTPDLAEDYVHFFDTTTHSTGKDEHKCYCVCWCSDDHRVETDYSTRDKRRNLAAQYINDGAIQGYLAYNNDKVVGWCNANTKSDCLNCISWLRFMGNIPTEESTPDIKIKSVFCFAIAPKIQRKGIASKLLERVCQDAAIDGFVFVEAYPNKAFIDEAEDFMGSAGLFQKSGFTVHHETEQKLVMRKQLK